MDMVFMHGPAAAGKLTVARELSALTGLPVFHNHLVVDALLELFEFGTPEFVRLRERFWLDSFEAAASSDRSFIFTFAPEPTVPARFHQRVVDRVDAHGGSVRFVALTVSVAEQERRIENADRREFNKLSSLSTLRRIRAGEPRSVEVPPEHLSIDTESTPPAVAARRIRDTFGLVTQDLPSGYTIT